MELNETKKKAHRSCLRWAVCSCQHLILGDQRVDYRLSQFYHAIPPADLYVDLDFSRSYPVRDARLVHRRRNI